MTLDDLQKLATGSLLFSLDRIIAPRLVNIFYLLGLAAIVIWAISHFFLTFGFGFGAGLWGLLEIAVYGLLSFVVLRISCEAIIVYFEAHKSAVNTSNQPRPAASLIDEVRDAIEELAEEGDDATPAPAKTKSKITSKTTTKTISKAAPKTAAKTTAAKKPIKPRRTARRAPPAKS